MSITYNTSLIFAGFFLSLCVFSLLFGDNWLFRFASSIFSGALSAYFCVFLIEKLFYPQIIGELTNPDTRLGNRIVLILWVLAAVLIFFKLYAGKPRMGNPVMLILICTSASVMILGIVNGTLTGFYESLTGKFRLSVLPDQVKSDPWYWVKTITVILAASSTLFYTQHYSYRLGRKFLESGFNNKESAEPREEGFGHHMGEIVTGISLGAILAGCFIASAIVLVGHLSELAEALILLFQ